MSKNDKKRWRRLEDSGRAVAFGTLTALPLCGLILFFEITRPAQFSAGTVIPMQLSSMEAASEMPQREAHQAIARFKGVSAEVRQAATGQAGKAFSASDAQQAFADASFATLKAGFRTEFVTKGRRRIAIRIVSREPVSDQSVPDNARIMAIAPASTAKTAAFVWGPWLYIAEVEDKGPEPEIVVQKVL
ncbi:MAG: hypothetical protein HY765_03835 [Rhodomicrobium sp.]|nr:hypothetical protein [Rhodomicrobium sp.]